ncbi:MAG: nuclear transport factor 2 family protein [Myxococcales bacterium]|nr:nuclear transport factor 2 family protein [Myxococcales bacterium]
MTDIAKTPEELFEAFQEASLSQDADAFAALFSDDARLEFPFAGLAFAGRAAIRERAHQVWEGSPLRVQSFRVTSCKQSPDGCLVAEYQVQGSAGSVVRPFSVGGVAVLEARGGQILRLREYLDPSALADAQRHAVGSARSLLSDYYQAMSLKSADALADLYAENAVHEFGFTTPNRPQKLFGRDAVRDAFRERWKEHPLDIQRIENEFVLEGADPELVTAQWRAQATIGATGKRVQLTGLLVLRVQAGYIVHTRDYMDSIGLERALGRTPFPVPEDVQNDDAQPSLTAVCAGVEGTRNLSASSGP